MRLSMSLLRCHHEPLDSRYAMRRLIDGEYRGRETKEEAIEKLVDDTGVLAEVDWFTIEALIGSKAWKSHVPKSITLVGGDSHAE